MKKTFAHAATIALMINLSACKDKGSDKSSVKKEEAHTRSDKAFAGADQAAEKKAAAFGKKEKAPEKAMSEQEYKAACKQIPVKELTRNPDQHNDEKVTIRGKVVVFEEKSDKSGKVQAHLVLSVKDPSKTLRSGLLPVYVLIDGRTDAFVNDRVIVHGGFRGNHLVKLQSIRSKTLPRIDARYVKKLPRK